MEEDPDADETADMAWLLYDSALAASGFQVDDTEAFSSRVHRAMAKTLNLSSMELLEEADIPDEVSAVGASLSLWRKFPKMVEWFCRGRFLLNLFCIFFFVQQKFACEIHGHIYMKLDLIFLTEQLRL